VTVGEPLVVVVTGDIAAVTGVMPATGEIPGTAGVIAVAGAVAGVPARLAGVPPAGGGGVWPKEVNTSVAEQKLAISSFFIGLIGKFFPGSNSDTDFPLVYLQ